VTEPHEEVAIRLATSADARAVAEIHVRGWQWAYPGQVPDHILDGLSVDRREAMWRETVSDPGERRLWVAEREDQIVGFAATEPSRDEAAGPEVGEVSAIYIEEAVAGTGVGRASRFMPSTTSARGATGPRSGGSWPRTTAPVGGSSGQAGAPMEPPGPRTFAGSS
jgi:hypothetical protein